MIKHYTFITLLLVVLMSPLCARAATRIRAKPILKHDKEYNAILLHVAQYFVLTIPNDKTIDDIRHSIRCKFVIKADGDLRELEIENSDANTGIFDGENARRTEMWLRDAVLKGMGYVPAFNMTKIRSSKSKKKRIIVFSFGKGSHRPSGASATMGFNTDAMQANLNQSIAEYQKGIREGKLFGETPGYGMTKDEATRRYLHQNNAWTGFTTENIKSTIKPTYEPHRQSLPIIKTNPNLPSPSDSLPQIQIAISLQ